MTPPVRTSDSASAPWQDLARTLFYGRARLEFANVYRPDGQSARQVVASLGIPPLGRVAARFTFDAYSGNPSAAHGELILGLRPISCGISIGRSREETIINLFTRRQPSIFTANRELTRILLGREQTTVQVMGELKFYGSSLSAIEMGEAVSYQIERAHLREAYRVFEAEGATAASAFLKERYPFMDERLTRRAFLSRPRTAFSYLGELSAYFFLGLGLGQLVPDNHMRHALQGGLAYGLSNLFRGGAAGMRPARLAGSVAEGIPVALLHGLLASSFDRVGWQWNQRWIVEDFATLALYGSVKSVFAPSLTARAAADGFAAVERPWMLQRYLKFGGGLATAALVAGGIYFLATRESHAFNFNELDRRYGDVERERMFLAPLTEASPALGRGGFGGRDAAIRRQRRAQLQSALILARLLEGSDNQLAGAMIGGAAGSLERAIARLSPERRATLRRRLGETTLASLDSLARESNREIFYQDLLVLAASVENNPDFAASLLYIVQSQDQFPDLRARARERLQETIDGGGSFRPQAFFEPERSRR